ncbi:VWA domain-containing protein [Pontibacillus salipaludis]|uniref:VWA domain-containing protein n=1 Tax=Pontibacillus salipaludis TaxID=1697394 RepID=UPI0031ECD989
MKVFRLILIGLLICFFSACSNQGEQAKGEQKLESNEQDEEVSKDLSESEQEADKENPSSEDTALFGSSHELPETTKDLINQKQGKYGHLNPDLEIVKKKIIDDLNQLDPLPENSNEETKKQYFRYMYSLIAKDFPDPQNTIKKWEYGASGNPDLPDAKFQFKDNYNVEVILDASGSMAAMVDGQTRMDLAKESIQQFLSKVPEEAKVSLRVYGHKGSGEESDKELSCSSIQQVYSFQSYNKEKFSKALNQFEPKGWTPIADTLKESQKSMEQFDSDSTTNLIYLVSDGIETCGGDPVQVAEQFSDSQAQPIINIIGFQADSDAQQQLKQVAQASNGMYSTVNNQEDLDEEFDRSQEVLERWEAWKEDALSDAKYASAENGYDITRFKNDWYATGVSQESDIGTVLYAAVDEDIITYDQRKELKSYADEIEKLVKESQDQLIKELEDINIEKVEELKKSIEEKFSENTKE